MNADPFKLEDSISTPVLVGAVVLYVVLLVFGVYLYCRVARKAGYSPWAGLLLLVPVANVVVMLMFAFSEWPIERELKTLRAQLQQSDAGHARFGAAPSFGSTADLPGQTQSPPGAAPAGHGAPGYGTPGYGAPGYGTPGYGTPGPGATPPTTHSGISPDPFNAPPSQP